jgi:hypothetical protein
MEQYQTHELILSKEPVKSMSLLTELNKGELFAALKTANISHVKVTIGGTRCFPKILNMEVKNGLLDQELPNSFMAFRRDRSYEIERETVTEGLKELVWEFRDIILELWEVDDMFSGEVSFDVAQQGIAVKFYQYKL